MNTLFVLQKKHAILVQSSSNSRISTQAVFSWSIILLEGIKPAAGKRLRMKLPLRK